MISFNNDYSEVGHHKILLRLNEISSEQNPGYGNDKYSKLAQDLIKKSLKDDSVDIHFVVGGTQANLVCLSAFLRPYEAVIACNTGHINVHETGAIEATGHKICTVPHQYGKVTPSEVEKCVYEHSDEHMVKPRIVFISNATELGTIYSLEELKALRVCCDKHNLLLYMDGARLGSAICAENNDVPFDQLTRLFDVFYIGGTKNGALFGEVIVIVNPKLKNDFRYHIKQKGALLAKGFILATQFVVLFEDNLFFELAKNANHKAEKIRIELKKHNIKLHYPTTTNQIFPILTKEQVEKLRQSITFSIWEELDQNRVVIRLVTSWATSDANVEILKKEIAKL